MFVKVDKSVKWSIYDSAININNFDIITVRRDGDSYSLSVRCVPYSDANEFHDIATFSSEPQARAAFDNLMEAIANKEHSWSLDK